MPGTRNLCAQIPIDLHQRICEAREQSGLTTAQYITNLLIEYYEIKETGGKTIMEKNTRTMAFQIPENLFQRIKAHLERETVHTGKKLTQRDFVLGLVVAALDEAERLAGTNSPKPEEQFQESPGVPTDEAATDPDSAKNSDLPDEAPADGASAEDAPGSEAFEGETGHEGGAEPDEGIVASGEGDADAE